MNKGKLIDSTQRCYTGAEWQAGGPQNMGTRMSRLFWQEELPWGTGNRFLRTGADFNQGKILMDSLEQNWSMKLKPFQANRLVHIWPTPRIYRL